MIYLDSGATSFHKPACVKQAVLRAMERCANPGRGGYKPAVAADREVYHCRELAGELFDCDPEQVVFTANCTHGLNIAINTLVKPGTRVVVSGFEHNAVMRPLYARGAKITVAGMRLFDWADTLAQFEKGLKDGAQVAVFTHMSNVFGYILPAQEMAALCKTYGVPFIVDAAQSAGTQPVKLRALGADFIAMPGHKGLLGPQGTGLLLCNRQPTPFLYGGTGSEPIRHDMPDTLPERAEAGTLNVPGIAGLGAGLRYLKNRGIENIAKEEEKCAKSLVLPLNKMGFMTLSGEHQGGTISFVPQGDCEELAGKLAAHGIGVRAGLHCAPLAHESAGTLETGTVRVSFGWDASLWQAQQFLHKMEGICSR
jgi:selenocysteine lyase/cysteine desulfurase